MIYRNIILTGFICMIMLWSCDRPVQQELSPEGIWISTPDTSDDGHVSNWTTALLIGENSGGTIEARGCFMWEGSYYNPWELEQASYNDSVRTLTLLDSEGDRYEGIADPDLQTIRGYFWSDDPDEEIPFDTVAFIRADPKLAQTLFYPRPPGPNGETPYRYRQPETTGDGLRTADISTFGVDTSALETLLSQIISQDYGRLESLLVMKDSSLVLEEYFYGYDRSRKHNIHSCTKSIASLLLGIAMEQNREVDLSDPLFGFFPEYDSLARDGKELITLEHLLTMIAGLPVDDVPGWIDRDDQVLNILSRPLAHLPGKPFQYNNDNSILIGAILGKITGRPADLLASQYLFGPMGISDCQWAYVDGLPQCHSDLQMLPRDMAKIGQLVLNDGRWDGQQLVPGEWIRESTRIHVAESEFFDYGYYWWHRSEGNRAWWDQPADRPVKEHEINIALGFGGQYIMIIRDLNMVVVTTASDYADGPTARSKVPMVIDRLVPLFE